jgi:Membrane-bound lytic murein transglycosylase B
MDCGPCALMTPESTMTRRSAPPVRFLRRSALPGRAIVLAVLAVVSAEPAHADFQSCVAGLRSAAAAKGVSSETFDRLTSGLEPNPDVLKSEAYQPEFKTAIWDYLAGSSTRSACRTGRRRWRSTARRSRPRSVDRACPPM